MISLRQLLLGFIILLFAIQLATAYLLHSRYIGNALEQSQKAISEQANVLVSKTLLQAINNLRNAEQSALDPMDEVSEAFGYSDSLMMLIHKSHSTALKHILGRMVSRLPIDAAAIYSSNGELLAQSSNKDYRAWLNSMQRFNQTKKEARDIHTIQYNFHDHTQTGTSSDFWSSSYRLKDPFGDVVAYILILRNASRDAQALNRTATALGVGWARISKQHMIDHDPTLEFKGPAIITPQKQGLFTFENYYAYCAKNDGARPTICALLPRSDLAIWQITLARHLGRITQSLDNYLALALLAALLLVTLLYLSIKRLLIMPAQQELAAIDRLLKQYNGNGNGNGNGNQVISGSVIREIYGIRQAAATLRSGIRERTQLLERSEFEALHDDITRLPNRRALMELLARLGTDFRPADKGIGLILIQHRNFGRMQDLFGYIYAHNALRDFSRLLRNALDDDWKIFHLGSDRFLLLGYYQSNIGNAAKEILDRLVKPQNNRTSRQTAAPEISAIHISSHNIDLDMESLINILKMASRYEFSEDCQRLISIDDRMLKHLQWKQGIEKALPLAIINNELTINFQPICDTRTRALKYFEVLLRWNSHNLGMVSPADFIPIAESNGQISSIGRWVIRCAFQQLSDWDKMGGTQGIHLSVNISPLQLNEPDLGEFILREADALGIAAARLILEITESQIINLSSTANANLKMLRHAGIRIAIDDFGDGYSSMGRLLQIDARILKIDRQFVSSCLDNDSCRALLRSLVQFASNLHMEVVAEGVETNEQLAFLRENGCDSVQGYLISKPLEAKGATEWRQHYSQDE